MFKEELTLIICNLAHKTEEQRTLPNSFYEADITLLYENHTKPALKKKKETLDRYPS